MSNLKYSRLREPESTRMITGSNLEHEVDGTSVRSDSYSTAFWDRLVCCQRDDGLRIRQGLDLQTVFLHQ